MFKSILKQVVCLVLLFKAAEIWSMIHNDFSSYNFISEVTADGNLFMDLLCLIVILGAVFFLRLCNDDNKHVFLYHTNNVIKIIGLSLSSTILINGFPRDYQYEYILGEVQQAFWISFGVISLAYVVLEGVRFFVKKGNKALFPFAFITVFIMVFSCIYLYPSAMMTIEKSQGCDSYKYRFDNSDNYYKYKKLMSSSARVYNLIEKIDDTTIVVDDLLYGEGVHVEYFKTKQQCDKFIKKYAVLYESWLKHYDRTPTFLDDQTILIHTEPDISVIEENKNDSLKLMFPIALVVTVFAFVVYGVVKCFYNCSRK